MILVLLSLPFPSFLLSPYPPLTQAMPTATKKAAAKPHSPTTKAHSAAHPTWVDMIKVRHCPLSFPIALLTFFPSFHLSIQECIAGHPQDARAGVSRPTIKKVPPLLPPQIPLSPRSHLFSHSSSRQNTTSTSTPPPLVSSTVPSHTEARRASSSSPKACPTDYLPRVYLLDYSPF